MVRKEILVKLIDCKKAAILQSVLNSSEEMYLKEIADKSKVSITSTFRILKELVDLDILNKKEWKTSKVYFCQDNEKVNFLKELFHEEFDGVKEFIDLVKDINSIQNVILHGVRKKGKADVLLIGQEIDNKPIEDVCNKLKNKGFELTFLILTREQYTQMAKMGLYSGEKKILK